MERGICYFNLGAKCLTRLCVSLHSLRKYYQGAVSILSGGGDDGICDRIGAALGADVVPISVVQRRRHTAYCAKASLWRSAYETTLLVDSDTVFMGSPVQLLDWADEGGLVVTRFSDWVTVGRMVSGRILKWRGVKCEGVDVENLIDKSLEAPRAAINTGCVAWHREKAREFLEDWERLTDAGWRCPLTDETCAQILLRKHQHVMVDDRFNCSPLYGKSRDKVVMWHQHGGKCVRPEAQHTWVPWFQEVWQQDIASVRSWMPQDDREKYKEFME